MAEAKTTTDHETIRQWAEERDGTPASVIGTSTGDEPGILRIDFPDSDQNEELESIEWDEIFAKIDDADLEFLYQETTDDGSVSRFCKFVNKPR